MKNYISILMCLSLVPLSSSAATFDSELGLAFESTVIESISPEDTIKNAVETAIVKSVKKTENTVKTSTTEPVENIISELPTIETDVEAEVAAVEAQNNILRNFEYVKHIDLRDIVDHNNEVAKTIPDPDDRLFGTSKKILKAVSEDTKRFTGYIVDQNGKLQIDPLNSPSVVYYENGARGPLGHDTQKDGDSFFEITKEFPKTHKNTIFSVDYESAVQEADKTIHAKLLLFIHDSERGYFFRRLTVKVDWSKNKTHSLEDVVSITAVQPDISLQDTDFKLKGSIATQKIILEDQNSGITKVFPVTVGAMDIRDQRVDGKQVVEPMTFWVPDGVRRKAKRNKLASELQKEFQDFSNATFVKRTRWSDPRVNTFRRVTPSYYSGRPFIALIDLNYAKDSFYDGYREIALHFQIKSTLHRGFKSHGCIRVRDKDLYQVDAFINGGSKDLLKATFKMTLPKYLDLNHPHPYRTDVSQVKYSSKKLKNGQNIKCKVKLQKDSSTGEPVVFNSDGKAYYKSRNVRWNTLGSNRKYHTIIDTDCLTATGVYSRTNTNNMRDYLLGLSAPRPDVFATSSIHPIETKAINTLSQHGINAEDMTQKERLITIAKIKIGEEITLAIQKQERRWPVSGRPLFKKRRKKDFYIQYSQHCSGKLDSETPSNVDCSSAYNTMKNRIYPFK